MWPHQRERFVEAMGERGFVIESGAGSHVVIILPSMLVLTESYRPTIRELSRRGFHVFALGMPGMGRGSKLREPWGFDRYAQWINAALGVLQIARATIIGHSNSGAAAVHLAAHFPNRVTRLILADPIGAARESLLRVIVGRGVDGALEFALSAAGWHHVAYNMIFHARNFWNQVRLSATTDLTEIGARVSAPTLVAWGALDHTMPVRNLRVFRSILPHTTVYRSPSGSHDWIVDHPHEFARISTQ